MPCFTFLCNLLLEAVKRTRVTGTSEQQLSETTSQYAFNFQHKPILTASAPNFKFKWGRVRTTPCSNDMMSLDFAREKSGRKVGGKPERTSETRAEWETDGDSMRQDDLSCKIKIMPRQQDSHMGRRICPTKSETPSDRQQDHEQIANTAGSEHTAIETANTMSGLLHIAFSGKR